jgi:lipoprotein-anchoring transpeptidase ErfK/SrfK
MRALSNLNFAWIVLALVFWSAPALAIDPAQIDTAAPGRQTSHSSGLDPLIVKVEILLDRSHFSPGEIDGKPGENLTKALTAFAATHGTSWSGKWNEQLWQALTADAPQELFTKYTITENDVRGPFLQKVPSKLEDMAGLPALSYTSPREELAERFHVSENLLSALNPQAHFDRADETIIVPQVADNPLTGKVARIIVDKSAQTVTAFDAQTRLLAFYPATVGSEEKPAPSGTLKVTGVQKNPTYHYNPDYHFKGVTTQQPFTIKPGPNNPVGVVWIGLSAQGYGIHGTPDPSKVSKTESHGCVRLTNWDALQLAAAVHKGIPVDFVEGEQSAQTPQTSPSTTGQAVPERTRRSRRH